MWFKMKQMDTTYQKAGILTTTVTTDYHDTHQWAKFILIVSYVKLNAKLPKNRTKKQFKKQSAKTNQTPKYLKFTTNYSLIWFIKLSVNNGYVPTSFRSRIPLYLICLYLSRWCGTCLVVSKKIIHQRGKYRVCTQLQCIDLQSEIQWS